MNGMDSYIAIIDEFIEDENKIVTYKMLSQHLALPVNKSKEILTYYKNNSGSSKLYALYSLIGKYKGKMVVCIVPGCKLDWTKSRFDSVISCHIYCIQKANLKDPATLYGVDYDMTKNALYKCASYSMIQFNGSKQLTDEEIKNFQHSKKLNETEQNRIASNTLNSSTPTEERSSAKPLKSFFSQKPSNKARSSPTNQTPQFEESNADVITSNKPTSQKPSQQNKPTGMKMFMTAGKTDLFETSKNKPSSNVNNSKKSSFPENERVDISLNDSELLALSEKMEVDDFDSTVNKTPTLPTIDQSPTEAAMDVDVKSTVAEQTVQSSKKNSQKKNGGNKVKSQKSLSRKYPVEKGSDDISKKRKRIKEVFSSSSSESEEEFMDDSNVIPPSPPPSTAAVLAPKNPRKKRVLKSRTYLDDEGAMLTEKVWEEVSCSSEEEKEEIKSSAANKSPGMEEKLSLKQSSSGKQKQATLFGFFNKKQ